MLIGILDDDNRYIDILKEKLNVFGENTYKTYIGLSKKIFEEDFDIFFLDVMLEGEKSFDFGEQLIRNKPKTTLVYISSIDDFVYDSIYQTSFFFIRKSTIDKDLLKFFNKYYKRIADENMTFEFISCGIKELVLQKNIIYITSKKNCIVIKTYTSEYLVYNSLKKIYNVLNKDMFYKLNSYTILNFESVESIEQKGVLMKNNENIHFTRNSKHLFIDAYRSYRKKKVWN